MESDSLIRQDIIATLEREPSLDARHIVVMVNGGIATLSGSVASYGEKWSAERCAQRVAGVKGIAITLEVDLPGPQIRTDADIALTVSNIIAWTQFLPKDSIRVMVENGWVTLVGEVGSDQQRCALSRSIRDLLGVRGLSEAMMIKPSGMVDPASSHIESALKRGGRSDTEPSEVKIRSSEDVLSATA